MARRQQRMLTVVTILVATLSIGVALVAAHGRSEPTRPELDLRKGLLVSTRAEFRICVELSPGLDSSPQRTAIGRRLLTALDQVREHPDWSDAYGQAEYDRSRVIAWGCPRARLPERHQPKGTVAGPGLIRKPSPYRVWVYVLDEPTGDRVLGRGVTSGIATAEAMRAGEPKRTADGHETVSAFPVSAALLIRRAQLSDPAQTADSLGEAAGLTPA